MLASLLTKVGLSKLKGMSSFDDSFYEEITDEDWQMLKTHTPTRQKNAQVDPGEMLFMQTNVLSPIKECFDLQAPQAPTRPRDRANEKRPPKTKVFVKKSPNEPLVKHAEGARLYNADGQAGSRRARERKKLRETTAKENGMTANGEETRVKISGKKEPKINENIANIYTRTRSKTKLKTKLLSKRSKSLPSLSRRMGNTDEEFASRAEYSQIKTGSSFSSYVKRRTPNFLPGKKLKSKKLKRSSAMHNLEVCGFIKGEDSLHVVNDKNVIFNPIFEDDEKVDHVYYVAPTRDDHVQGACNGFVNSDLNEEDCNGNSKGKYSYNNNVIDDDNSDNHRRKETFVRYTDVEEPGCVGDFDLNNYEDDDDDDDEDHVVSKEPIKTFNTIYIRRELYVIEEEPESNH